MMDHDRVLMGSRAERKAMLSRYVREEYGASLPRYDKKKQIELVSRASKGCEESKYNLITSYMPFIILEGSRVWTKDLTCSDIVQEGWVVGLVCINKFDPALGNRFSTFYCTSLRNKLSRLSMTNHLGYGIKCSMHNTDLHRKTIGHWDNTIEFVGLNQTIAKRQRAHDGGDHGTLTLADTIVDTNHSWDKIDNGIVVEEAYGDTLPLLGELIEAGEWNG